jgi:hypothetical protein
VRHKLLGHAHLIPTDLKYDYGMAQWRLLTGLETSATAVINWNFRLEIPALITKTFIGSTHFHSKTVAHRTAILIARWR